MLRVCQLILLLTLAFHSVARSDVPGSGYAQRGPVRFLYHDRPVKVVLLAGSIGAYRDQPYARVLQEVCSQIEMRNLSAVGLGAFPLHEIFRRDVVPFLPRVRPNTAPPNTAPPNTAPPNTAPPNTAPPNTAPPNTAPSEHWLMWNGGLNSVDNSFRSNEYIRRTFVLAHQHGMRVIGLTLSPWGSLATRSRFAGAAGLATLTHTTRIVDYVLGRITPPLALGSYARNHAPSWHDSELCDIGIDLYNSPLRDSQAQITRAAEPLLQTAAQWFLRPDLQSFDTTHPNRMGHAIIARLVCEQAPASWGCDCAAIADAHQ